MSPPRVKVYGFLSLTKRQYLFSLVLGLALLGVVILFWYTEGQKHFPHPLAAYVPLVIFGAVVLEAIEVYFVLRKFARLEAEQTRARASQSKK